MLRAIKWNVDDDDDLDIERILKRNKSICEYMKCEIQIYLDKSETTMTKKLSNDHSWD